MNTSTSKTSTKSNKKLTRSDIALLSPTDLIVELARRGIKAVPHTHTMKGRSTCPRCEHEGPIDRDFGVRVMRGEVKPQSWCRVCRANPHHGVAKVKRIHAAAARH